MKPPEIVRREDTQSWLKLAYKDFEVGKDLLRKGKDYWDYALFHFQQSVEKSLKAFLVWHDQPLKKVHDLATLGQMCTSIDIGLERVLATVDSLSMYAVDARYPGELIHEISVQQARDAADLSNQTLNEILRRLPGEFRKLSAKRTSAAKPRRRKITRNKK